MSGLGAGPACVWAPCWGTRIPGPASSLWIWPGQLGCQSLAVVKRCPPHSVAQGCLPGVDLAGPQPAPAAMIGIGQPSQLTASLPARPHWALPTGRGSQGGEPGGPLYLANHSCPRELAIPLYSPGNGPREGSSCLCLAPQAGPAGLGPVGAGPKAAPLIVLRQQIASAVRSTMGH